LIKASNHQSLFEQIENDNPFTVDQSVRKDGFKLEGGELFKGVFANFSKLE